MTVVSIHTAHIEEIGLDLAGPFIEKWHYSGCVPTGKNVYFGWFVPAQDGNADTLFGRSLYAVADYGIGVNPFQAQFLSDQTGYPVTNDTMMELKRLCRTEPKIDSLPLTAFLSRCHKILKREWGIRYIVSFSDPAYGHSGTIYRAANFTHLGQTNPEWHLQEEDGTIRHRRYAYRYAQRNNVSTPEAREALGVTRILRPGKDRWFRRL